MDLTPVFNQVLAAHDARPVQPYVFRKENLDEFLKEAYRIRAHIAQLHSHLTSIRQSYLSTAHPPRRKQIARANGASTDKDAKHLTDTERNEIDSSAKDLLRELSHAITKLSQTEQIRQEAETHIAYKKRAKRGLGALGRWAAGGAITAKSPEEELEEAKSNTVKAHRESIIWYLQRTLEECGRFQRSMMEIRITREVEKSKSMLYKARGTMPALDDYSGSNANYSATTDYRGKSTQLTDEGSASVEQQLDPEQLQLFAQENQDMLKYYEDTLDQVRTAEKSLLEISELQTTLAANLNIQAEHIDQLVADSQLTTENVGSGNKQLKKAAERRSTAQMVFWSTCAFCTTLILWDLFI
ncbi:hypothetical protein SLS60_008034 [Paraconiothyrium brasiliense]|uniref:t-SNARE coiled-coil homology domain-containing protein n=1 Tax=Paraconiothyrium brasiliense TaxID=300254 RepID=A0ABR3R3B7_9PLEO